MFDQLRVDTPSLGQFRFGFVGDALDQRHEFALALIGAGDDAGLQFAQAAADHGPEQFGRFTGNPGSAASPTRHRHCRIA